MKIEQKLILPHSKLYFNIHLKNAMINIRKNSLAKEGMTFVFKFMPCLAVDWSGD